MTEIEQLARLYPYAEPLELKVKSIVNFATQEIGFRELERLEKAILAVIRGQLDDEMLFKLLVKPPLDGGVGLPDEQARGVIRRVFALLAYSRDVEKYRAERTNDAMFLMQRKFIDRILDYIAVELGLSLTKERTDVLRTAIAERVGGIINGEDFERRMVLSTELGGVAFASPDASKISRLLEKLIAQGGYVILANELLGAHS